MVFRIKGGYNPDGLRREIMEASVIDAIAEKIQNGFDWASLSVWVMVNFASGLVEFSDRGTGMTKDALKDYFVLKKSRAAKRATARGFNGIASKFIFVFGERETIRTCTSQAPDAPVFEVSYTFQDLLDTVFGNKEIDVKETKRKLDDPPTGSFSRFIIQGLNPLSEVFLREEYLRAELSDNFAPQFIEKIFVNSKPIIGYEIHGQVIKETFKNEVLGEIITLLYMPESIKAQRDDLFFGVMGPVARRANFLNSLPQQLKLKVPEVFRNPMLCGEIDVEGFKKFRNKSSKSFQTSLYLGPEIIIFVDYLRRLGSKVEKAFNLQDAVVDDKLREELEAIKSLFEEVYGEGSILSDKHKVKPKPFTVSPRYITLEVGESYPFCAKPESGNYVWDDKKSGGSLDQKTGSVVIYTAGKATGMFELRVWEKDNPDFEFIVKIKIVKEKFFKISPSILTAVPGEHRKFHVKNTSQLVGEVVWKSDKCGGQTKLDGEDLIYVAGKEPGSYTLVAQDSKSKLRAEAQIIIVEEKPLPDKEKDSNGIIIKIDDYSYELLFKSLGEDVANISNIYPSKIDPKGFTIAFNNLHPMYQKCISYKGKEFRIFLIDEVIRHHVMQDETLTATEIASRIGQVKQTIFKGKKK